MNDTYLIWIAGALFVAGSAFSLWYLRREYRLLGKLSWFGSILHVLMYAFHGMFLGVLACGPGASTLPAMGPGGVAGIIVMVVGTGITVYAMDLFHTFSRWVGNKTPGLQTTGLYRYSRNPQFVGYGLLVLGFVIAWWNDYIWIGLLAYAALVYAVARVEEEHLLRVYGEPYRDYCRRVPRFLGSPKE
jgi:protein-S-isoprenylcysteine O-methyltransferase Ste14